MIPVSNIQVAERELNSPPQIPALTDKHTDGSTIRLFESGSIMQYLVDKYDTEHKVSYPHGTKEYYDTNSWVRQAKPRLGSRSQLLTKALAVLADGWSRSDAGPVDPLHA